MLQCPLDDDHYKTPSSSSKKDFATDSNMGCIASFHHHKQPIAKILKIIWGKIAHILARNIHMGNEHIDAKAQTTHSSIRSTATSVLTLRAYYARHRTRKGWQGSPFMHHPMIQAFSTLFFFSIFAAQVMSLFFILVPLG